MVRRFRTVARMVTFLHPETHDKLKRSCQRYCDGTSVHGCNELYHAKTLFWTSTWSIIIFGALVITGYQCYSAIAQYIDQGTITQVLPPEKGSILYPSLAMCYIHWIYWVDFEKAYEMGFTKESLLYGISFINKIYSSTLFDVKEAKHNFTNTLAENNITTLSEFYLAVAMTFPMTEGGVFSLVDKDPPYFKTSQLLYKPPKYYMCYTVSGKEIEKVLEDNRNSADSITSRASKGLFSFSVQDPSYMLVKDYVTFEEYNYNTAHWLCEGSSYWAIHLEDYAKNYTKFTMPIRMFPDADADEHVVLKTDNEEYNVLMKPSVKRSKSTWKEPCTIGEKATSTNKECQKTCSAIKNNHLAECMYVDEAAMHDLDTVDNLCSLPVNFLRYQRENPSFKTYPCDNFVPEGEQDKLRTNKTTLGRLINLTSEIIDEINKKYEDCVNVCEMPCEIWQYSVSVSVLMGSPAVLENTFKNQTTFNYYYPQETDVLIIIDRDAQTWEDFVANVGGLLGVWTGASFISFLQLPYLCCCVDVDEFNLTSFFKFHLPLIKRTTPQSAFDANVESGGSAKTRKKRKTGRGKSGTSNNQQTRY